MASPIESHEEDNTGSTSTSTHGICDQIRSRVVHQSPDKWEEDPTEKDNEEEKNQQCFGKSETEIVCCAALKPDILTDKHQNSQADDKSMGIKKQHIPKDCVGPAECEEGVFNPHACEFQVINNEGVEEKAFEYDTSKKEQTVEPDTCENHVDAEKAMISITNEVSPKELSKKKKYQQGDEIEHNLKEKAVKELKKEKSVPEMEIDHCPNFVPKNNGLDEGQISIVSSGQSTAEVSLGVVASAGPNRTHILAESQSMTDLILPIKTSARIKYTSLAVSGRYIALGASTGCVYIFDGESLKYLQLVPSEIKDGGAVVRLAFGPDYHILGLGTSKGHVVVLELQLEKRISAQKLRTSKDHVGFMITELCWSCEGNRLYVGDENGKVTFVNVVSSKAKGFLSIGSELVMKLDSPVVQIDVSEDKVLVSTYNRSYLGFTNIQKFQVVGTKLRDGRYGACFYHMTGVLPVIYCARPGSRMWEVDHDGNVLNTHQFKQLLDTPALPVINLVNTGDDFLYNAESSPGPQSMAFPKLVHCGDKFLVTFNDRGLFVFNPAEVKVVLWTDQVKDVLQLVCAKNDMYILNSANGIRKLTIHPIPKLVSHVYSLGYWVLSSRILLAFQTDILKLRFLKYISAELISDLQEKLAKEEPQLSKGLASFLTLLTEKIANYRKSKKSADSSSQDCNSVAGGFCRNENGMYVRELRSISVCSDDMDLANDALLERVIAHKKDKADDSKSLDSISTTSSTESDPTKALKVTTQAKLKILSFTDKIKKLAKSASSQDIEKIVKTLTTPDDSNSISTNSSSTRSNSTVSTDESSSVKGNEDLVDSKMDSNTCELKKNSTALPLIQYGQTSLASASDISANRTQAAAEDETLASQDGDTISDNLSLSSSEMMFGSAATGTPDPEPRYAKPSVHVKGKNKKKKAKLIDLDGNNLEQSDTGVKKMRRSISAKEKKVHLSSKMQQRSKSFVDDKMIKEYAENSTQDGNLKKQECEDGIVFTVTVDSEHKSTANGWVKSEESTPPSSHAYLQTPTGSSPVTTSLSSSMEADKTEMAMEDAGKASSSSGSPASPKNTLSAVRDKISAQMQITAKSFMLTLKETGQKLGKKNAEMLEIPAMVVTADVNVTSHLLKDSESSALPTEEEKFCSISPELSELIELTKVTVIEVERDEIVYNPSACKIVLGEWLRKLHIVTRQVHKNKILKMVQHALEEQTESENETKTENLEGNNCDKKNNANKEEITESDSNALCEDSDLEYNHDTEITDQPIEEITVKGTQANALFDCEKDFTKEIVCEIFRKSSMSFPEFDNPMYINCPFNIDCDKYPTYKADLEGLATMCFEFGVHGDISKYMDPFTTQLEVNEQGLTLTEQEKTDKEPAEKNRLFSNRLSESDLDEICSFLRCYFYCLDLERVHQAIMYAGQDQRPRLWKVYMEMCDQVALQETVLIDHLSKDETNEVYDRLRSGVVSDQRSTPALIQRLFSANVSKTLKFCAEVTMSKWMFPLDILYMCAKRKDAARSFVYYYKVFSEDRSSYKKEDVMKEFCQDPEVYLSLLECLLQTEPPDSPVSCHCGFPLPYSHKLSWKESDLINDILRLKVRDTSNQKKDLAYQYGYWYGYLVLVKTQPKDETSMKLIFQLNDKEYLKEEICKGFFARNAEEWKLVFHFKSLQDGVTSQRNNMHKTLQDILCLNCSDKTSTQYKSDTRAFNTCEGSDNASDLKESDRLHADSQSEDVEYYEGFNWSQGITWEYLAGLMVERLGSCKALAVLKEVNIPNGALPFEFHQELLYRRVAEKQQSLLVHNMLERLSTYLWSRRPTSLPPKVVAAVNKEKEALESHGSSDFNVQDMFSFLAGESPKLSVEEPEAHWGVKFNLSSACPCCGVSMSKQGPQAEAGLVIFPCGHGYHKLCSTSGMCSLCSHRQLNPCV